MTWDDFPNNCNSKTLDSINAKLHNISNVPGNTFNIALSSIFTAFNFDESCSVILINVFKLHFLSCRHWQAALFYDDVDHQLSTSKTAALFITPKMSNILCKLWYLKSFKQILKDAFRCYRQDRHATKRKVTKFFFLINLDFTFYS